MNKKTNEKNYDHKILRNNLKYLAKRHKLDFDKINISKSTFANYVNGVSCPPITTVVHFMTFLKDPHHNITFDQLLFKNLIPKNDTVLSKPRKNMFTRSARERKIITEAEYQALLRPHSKEDLAYINRDDGQYGEANPSAGGEDELSMNELKEIDTACTKYLESVGSKDKFNPSDIGNNTPMHLKMKRSWLSYRKR